MKPLILIILISINPNWNADSAFVVVKKGRDALVANDYQKAEELFDAGLKLAGVGDSLTIQNAYRYKGILEEYRGEYSYAIKYFNKSLSYARDEDFKFRSNVFNDIGSSYHYLSEYDSAIAYYTTAFELAKKDSMLQERGMILGNMADVYCDQEEYHQALQLLRQNKNHFKYDLHKEIRLTALSTIYLKLGNYDSAKVYIQRSEALNTQTKNKLMRCSILMNKGALYAINNELDSAKRNFKKSLNLAFLLQHAPMFNEISDRIFDYSIALENFVDYDFLIDLKNQFDALDLTLAPKFYLAFAKELENKAQFREAYENYQTYHELQDSLNKRKYSQKVLNLQGRFEFFKKNAQIRHLSIQNKNAKLELKAEQYRRNLISIITLFLILLSSLIFVNQRRKKKVLKERLDLKTSELAKRTLKVFQKNSSIEEISKSLKDTLSGGLIEQDIQGILRKIQLEDALEKDWVEFEKHFEGINPNFFKKLNQHSPKLTPQDHKICALITLRYSNKDLSNILNVSVAGVKSSKQRIAKKLELEDARQLFSFLTAL